MPPRKRAPRKTTSKQLSNNTKKYIYISIFVFFSVVALLSEQNSVLWKFLSNWLFSIFWEYYKIIFSPVLFMISFFLIKDSDYQFDTNKWVWLFIYYISITTFIWVFIENYYGIFNLSSHLNNLLWPIATGLGFFMLFLTSLIILFRFSVVNLFHWIFNFWELLTDIKNSFIWIWQGYNFN